MHHDEKEWDKPEEFNPGGLCDPHPLLAQGMAGWVQQERLSLGGLLGAEALHPAPALLGHLHLSSCSSREGHT